MTTKHTPGPWTIYQHPLTPEPSSFDIFGLRDGEEVDIAENVTAANAALIAAAPALYEALKGIVADFDRLPTGDYLLNALLDKARAALASADGGAA